jgi:hypothetical protein
MNVIQKDKMFPFWMMVPREVQESPLQTGTFAPSRQTPLQADPSAFSELTSALKRESTRRRHLNESLPATKTAPIDHDWLKCSPSLLSIIPLPVHRISPQIIRPFLSHNFVDLIRLLQFTLLLFFPAESSFDISGPPSTFGVRSLPIPRSASDCRSPDAMGRSRRLPPDRCHPASPGRTV